MQTTIALLVLLGLAGADALMTAAPARRTAPGATASRTGVTAPSATPANMDDGDDSNPDWDVSSFPFPGPTARSGTRDSDDFTVSLGTSGTASTDDASEADATVPGDPPTSTSRSSARYLVYYTHYDFGIGTAWPRGTAKPACTKWTKVGDTYNQWTQDVYTATVTRTLTHQCGACAIVWTTPHHGYARAKVWETSTAAEPFTITEVECEGPEGTGYLLPPHTPTDPRSTETRTQTYASSAFVTYLDHGPSTIFPPGIPSPSCTRFTTVYGGGGFRVYKQAIYPFSTVKTVTKDCGSCALAWSTNFFWQYTKGEINHFDTRTNSMHVATKLECGPAVPTTAFEHNPDMDPVTTTTTTAPY